MLGETTMKKMNTRSTTTLAMVLFLALAGCQSESPTEPSTGGNGGNTPPTGNVAISLSASSANLVVGSSTVITAKVTTGGANVVDGTAIEFATDFGTFVETSSAFALRTTTGGNATATLTSASPGTAKVTARLGNSSGSISVNFKVDGGGGTGPTISSVSPNSGPPSGNQVVTITGRNFEAPARVLFGSKEATVVSVSSTEIKAVTPSYNITSSTGFEVVDVRVIVAVGTGREAGTTLAGGYRYEQEILTPSLTLVSPASGPNEGGTRITIFGSGFQSPVKAFFGSAATAVELEIVNVTFSQIQAVTPPAAGLGAAFANSSVPLRVLNVASNKEATLQNAFRYGPKLDITGVSPSIGSHLGGTRVTIFGFGFDDPVQVSIGDTPAQVVRVSGTEIVAITSALQDCANAGGGSVKVTNLEEPSAAGTVELTDAFTYEVTTKITSATPLPMTEGQTADITVADPGPGAVKFTIDGSKTVFPQVVSVAADGTTVYRITVPDGLPFETEDCTTGTGVSGTRETVTDFDFEFTNILLGCSTTISLPVSPAVTTCVTAPAIDVSPALLAFGNDDADGVRDSGVLNVTVFNIGTVPVTLAAPQVPAPFVIVTPGSLSIPVGGNSVFGIGFNPTTVADFPNSKFDFKANGGNTVPVNLTGTGTTP
jgi:hypothetical protein